MVYHLLIIAVSFYLKHTSVFALSQDPNACKTAFSYRVSLLNLGDCYHNPDVLSNVVDTAVRHGYKPKTLTVTTEDGYVLTVFRIYPKDGSGKGKPPIFIQHGIATNSGPWIDKGNRSIAFALADLGYDVFLGNIRGSTYSKNNTKYPSTSYSFWNYTLDDMAANDIPAQLKLVTNITRSKVIYIGHSMGTTLYFMYASSNPTEADSLIQAMIAFAPIVYFKSNPFIALATPLVEILDKIHFGKIFYYEDFIHKLANLVCRFSPRICRGIQFIALGKSNQFLMEDLLVYYTNWPSTVAIRQFLQYVQMYNSKKFQKFDFGKDNTKAYHSNTPPHYNLGNISIPTYLYYGPKDAITDKEHVEKIYNELGSKVKQVEPVPKNNKTLEFCHFDFLYAAYLREFLFEPVFKVIAGYNAEPIS